MLFQQRFLQGIAEGRIRSAYRRWKRPTVRAGGTLRTAVGVLAIESVEPCEESGVSEADARQAGYVSREELLASLSPDGTLYRIAFRLDGPDPRVALREHDSLTPAEIEELRRRLAKLDAASRQGPWTSSVLQLIDGLPGRPAGELAAQLGFERAWLKLQIRKLKELGLTESLSPGYRLSPRGRSLLRS